MTNLEAEWRTCHAGVRQRHIDAAIHRYGIPAVTLADHCAVARIAPEGTHWRPDSDGIEALVVAVWAFAPRDADGRWVTDNQVVDLVAFRPAEPSRWWVRTGFATCLGEWSIPTLSDDPVHVWRTPLAWLRAGTSGICILDPSAARDVLLRCSAIVAEEVEHGREIRAIMQTSPIALPPIFVTETLRGAA
jgi:hypothetical protein